MTWVIESNLIEAREAPSKLYRLSSVIQHVYQMVQDAKQIMPFRLYIG
jgi:hypothetical protein